MMATLNAMLGIDLPGTAARAGRSLAGALVLAILIVTAFGLGTSALVIYLDGQFGIVISLLIVAAGFALVAMIFWLAFFANRRPPEQVNTRHEGSSALLTSAAFSLLPIVLRSPPLALAAGLAGAAYLIGRRNQSDAPSPPRRPRMTNRSPRPRMPRPNSALSGPATRLP